MILTFSDKYISKILNGEKTQTRRIGNLDKYSDVYEIYYEEPKYQIGCTYNIGEPYQIISDSNNVTQVLYKSDYKGDMILWRDAKSLPEIYSRAEVKITNVYIQYLSEMTDEELQQEGYSKNEKELFARDWNNIYPNNRFENNPLVWVYTFNIVKGS